jgi:hypothetical protein
MHYPLKQDRKIKQLLLLFAGSAFFKSGTNEIATEEK